jgi:Leucine-rich repeat (LRR) protein
MLTKIDLSGFNFVSRSSIKELLEAVELMPCMRALSLRNNRITDDYETEVLSIFNNKNLVNVDLS